MSAASPSTTSSPVDPAARRWSGSDRVTSILQRNGAVLVLLIVAVVSALAFDGFASSDNLRNIAVTASFGAVIALGMTFVILTGGIDLSVGSVFALGGVLAAYASQWGALPALLLPLAVCGAFGLLQGLCISRLGLAPFIVTLAGLLGARGLLLAITDEGAQTYLVPQGSAFRRAGQSSVLGIPVPVLITVGLFALGVLILQRTAIGQSVFAVGGSEDAAGLMGLPVARVKLAVYTMSGLLAGLAGALNTARLSSGVTTLGVGTELDAISAVVIGGTLLAGGVGTVGGTLAGVLLLGTIQNDINLIGDIDPNMQQVVSGVFLVVVVVAQTWLSRVRRTG